MTLFKDRDHNAEENPMRTEVGKAESKQVRQKHDHKVTWIQRQDFILCGGVWFL